MNTTNAISDSPIIKDMNISNEIIQSLVEYLPFEYAESTMVYRVNQNGFIQVSLVNVLDNGTIIGRD